MSRFSSRERNVRIAAAYDTAPYDPIADETLAPQDVLGLAAVYGAKARLGDVLDLGCGGGSQLAYVGGQVGGRLVGTDLSSEACRRARSKLEVFGNRARVIQADFLDLDPQDLGRFDLIYNIGVLYVVPPEVQSKIRDIIVRCLKPGGVAVISYYAGSIHALRANLHRTLRAVVGCGDEPGAAVSKARAHLKATEAALSGSTSGRELLLTAIRCTQELSDLILYHEALNQAFDALQTTQIEQAFAAEGVGFAAYLGAAPFVGGRDSRSRAVAADNLDFSGGSYRRAVFVRWSDKQQGPDLRRSQISWTSSHTLTSSGAGAIFRGPGNVSVTIDSPVTAAMIQVLRGRPLGWAQAFSEGLQIAASRGFICPANQEDSSRADFMRLWGHGFLKPRVMT